MKYKLYQQETIEDYKNDDRIIVKEIMDSERSEFNAINECLTHNYFNPNKELVKTYADDVYLEDKYEALEHLYVMFNHGDRPTGAYATSLMMGDVIQLDDKFYRCNMMGFDEIETLVVENAVI